MRVTNLPDPVTPPTAPTVAAVQGMTLTADEVAVVLKIRDMFATGEPRSMIVRTEPGKPGYPSRVCINACTGTQVVNRVKVAS